MCAQICGVFSQGSVFPTGYLEKKPKNNFRDFIPVVLSSRTRSQSGEWVPGVGVLGGLRAFPCLVGLVPVFCPALQGFSCRYSWLFCQLEIPLSCRKHRWLFCWCDGRV